MSCMEWEHDIASELESLELDEHLGVCATCRQFAHELEANRVALRWMEIDAQTFDQVRRRVIAEIQAEKRRKAWWMWPVAAAACIVILWGALESRPWSRFENPARPGLVGFSKAPPKIEWSVKPVRPRPASFAARREPLVVKMLTNDPNVIIIWLVDQKGD